MNFTKVDSSTIREMGYDYDNHDLHVRFTSGSEYIYENVPAETYARLLEADSKGKFLHESVIGRFTYTRIK